MSDTFKFRSTGHCAILCIDNPPANTFDRATLAALKQRLDLLADDRDIYTLVMTGAGDTFFSAGADLKQFAEGDRQRAQDMATLFAEAFEALAGFRGLTIAAINGYAMGGGLECALACDLRIAEDHAVMALPEAAVGLLPCAGGTQRLPWLVGEGWAKRMILCGERLDAETAYHIGLVEQVVPRGEGLTSALALAERAARQSPGALESCKKLIQAARRPLTADQLPLERQAFMQLFGTQDQREGVAAFLEKRPPQWKNA
jgi:enoyl-CoA hydratase/carnithine racemase